MQRTTALRTGDLPNDARAALAGILHVDLSNPEDVITVTVSSQEGQHADRVAARARLLNAMNRLARKASRESDAQIDSLLREAVDSLRTQAD